MDRRTGRALLALGALAAAAVLPASADARGGAAKQDVAKAPDEVRAYWTAERKRDAVPRDRTAREDRAGRAKPGGTTQTWSTIAFDWTTADALAATNGKVYFTENGVNYVCSGTAVQSGTDSVVWTAGHCVHGGEGGAYVTNWAFDPAYGGRDLPLFAASSIATSPGWIAGEYGRDVGAAKVAPVGGRTLAQWIGAERPISFAKTLALNARVKSYGYPAAGKFNGQRLYLCDSYVSRRDTSVTPADYGIPCSMTGGSSGGGWIDTAGDLVSVNSYGYGSLKNVMFGPVLDGEVQSVLAAVDR